MSENSDYEEPISSKRLREALGEASIVLGRAAQDAMFRDLELNGITFKNAQYSLNEVQNALRRIWS